jgi:RNAse (barnase) inhibitor barstar
MDNLISQRFIALSQALGIEVRHINDIADDNDLEDEDTDKFTIAITEFDEKKNGIYYVFTYDEVVDAGEADIDSLWECILGDIDKRYHLYMDYKRFWDDMLYCKDAFDRGLEAMGEFIEKVKLFETDYYIFRE